MVKSYKLSASKVLFMLVVGIVLSSFGLYSIAQSESPLLLVMGVFIIGISFAHRTRDLLIFTEESFSLSPNFFGTKSILFKEIGGIRTRRGKIIVSGTGKVNEVQVSSSAFSSRDRIEVIARFKALTPDEDG